MTPPQVSLLRYRIKLAFVLLITTLIIVASFSSCAPRDATDPHLSRATAPAPAGLAWLHWRALSINSGHTPGPISPACRRSLWSSSSSAGRIHVQFGTRCSGSAATAPRSACRRRGLDHIEGWATALPRRPGQLYIAPTRATRPAIPTGTIHDPRRTPAYSRPAPSAV